MNKQEIIQRLKINSDNILGDNGKFIEELLELDKETALKTIQNKRNKIARIRESSKPWVESCQSNLLFAIFVVFKCDNIEEFPELPICRISSVEPSLFFKFIRDTVKIYDEKKK